ncbi:MAG: MBOAT family O-acyltransferase [Parafilimonas sp.]
MFFKPIYILILGGTIVIDYFVGIYLEKFSGAQKKLLLIVSIIANVGVLAVFKYYNFFIENTNGFLSLSNHQLQFPYLNILLPIGLSFHTFQAMSYTIEVYRGRQKPEKHFGIYALYVMFYPQLVAGPIERPQHMLHQFHEKKAFNESNLAYGLKLMLWGFFKKIFVADRLAVYVGTAYSGYTHETGSTLLLATFFFAIQIYCDFSGYSDIARGAAKTMGYDLMINFRRPYLAGNISDFWRRWHVSLSTWFRDFVYFPLGGNHTNTLKWCFNLMIVFLLSGIWHGANYTFVFWGFLHGSFVVVHKLSQRWHTGNQKKLYPYGAFKFAGIVFNFALVTFAWIFFRAENMQQAWDIIKKIFTNINGELYFKTTTWMLVSLAGIFIVLMADIFEEYGLNVQLLHHKHLAVRLITVSTIIISILLFGTLRNTSFIYFQF